jgi:hypothetical protein
MAEQLQPHEIGYLASAVLAIRLTVNDSSRRMQNGAVVSSIKKSKGARVAPEQTADQLLVGDFL